MRTVIWRVAGAGVSVVYVLLAGILTIQAIAARDGAVVNLNNEVVAVEPRSDPFLQWLAAAILGGLVFYLLAVHMRRHALGAMVSANLGFVVVALVLFFWSLTITVEGGEGPEPPNVGTALGWEGWLQEGSSNWPRLLVTFLREPTVHGT